MDPYPVQPDCHLWDGEDLQTAPTLTHLVGGLVSHIADCSVTVPEGFRALLVYAMAHDYTVTQAADACWRLHMLLAEDDDEEDT